MFPRLPVAVTGVRVTVGDTSRNFDNASDIHADAGPPMLSRLVTPDRNPHGGRRDDAVEFSFAGGLTPGRTFRFTADIDKDSGTAWRTFAA